MQRVLITSPTITGVILAGGAARRMGGIDKGLVPFQGQPLVAHLIARIAPQVTTLLISANRSQQEYAQFGYPIIGDSLPDYPGPLAGVLAALELSSSELLLVVPCDTPLLPHDLVQRLLSALQREQSEIAIPVAEGQRHAAVMLLRRSVADELRAYLLAGERKVQLWLKRHRTIDVDFSNEAAAFANLNTPQELQALEQYHGH